MATISITSGGMDAKLRSQATDTATRPSPATKITPAAPAVDPVGDPKIVREVAERENPATDDLMIMTSDDMHSLVDEMQKALDNSRAEPLNVDFRRDPRANGYVVEIRNAHGDVIRQFPPEKVLNMRSKLAELSGMVIDQVT